MKRLLLLITILLILLVFGGCSKKEVVSPTWGALSQVQIKEFIKQEKISPLAVENIDKITILLSDKGVVSSTVEDSTIPSQYYEHILFKNYGDKWYIVKVERDT